MLLFRRCPFLNPRTLRKLSDPNPPDWTNDWGFVTHALVGHKSHQSGRGELEHGLGPPAAEDPAWRHIAVELDHEPLAVQEEQVEREPHSDRVDAAAAGDQEPRAGLLTREQRQAEQSAGPGRRDANLEAEETSVLKCPEPAWNPAHTLVSAGEAILAPTVPDVG
jgi:hypothetical protein